MGWFSSSVDCLVLETSRTDHANALADIHAATFRRPWTDGEFHDLLRQDSVHSLHLRTASASKQSMIGFCLLRRAGPEAEVLTIAVTPRWQGYGAGRRLLDAALQWAHGERLESVFLEVDEHNASAIALYRKTGFITVGKRDGYYAASGGQRHGALVMRRDVG